MWNALRAREAVAAVSTHLKMRRLRQSKPYDHAPICVNAMHLGQAMRMTVKTTATVGETTKTTPQAEATPKVPDHDRLPEAAKAHLLRRATKRVS